MYAPFFGLKHEPFSIAPDPRYLFMSERHREALAHLLYGLGGGGGFVLLSGEIGTGKTTVCRLFLEQIPANCNVAYIFNPKLTVIELLQSVCDEFHIEGPARGAQPPTVKEYLDPLNAFLLREHAAGRNNVLIIDEAQNLAPEVLEQLRLLTNLETSERKLLQIILIGQPELRGMLARPELEQLAQRVIARFHLDALTETETAQYVQHRLEVAGLTQALPFEHKALARVHALSRGVPRRINLLCDRALLGAFAGGQPRVDRAIVDKAAAEVFDTPAARAAPPWRRTAAVLGLGLAAGAGLFAMASQPWKTPPPATAAAAPASAVPAKVAQAVPAAQPKLLTDQDQAWRELSTAWKLAPGDGEPCEALQREQVRCFSKNMSLALIRQLGRPGIVTLDAQGKAPSYALLTALGADSATLRAGGSEQTVTLAALATRWNGDFGTLWRAPAGYSTRASGREADASVEWLANRLATLDGKTPPAGKPALDAALRARVLAFQVAQGLPADGRPGPMTFMQLNRASGVDEPRLRTEP
ncbi:MAG: AAA family ATPase [Burkholderiales bacterium]|nr:AAA family ATPase [Burkholderiales bacterium]